MPQGGSSIITNVGRAFGRGVEAELHYVPGDAWDLFANTAYNDTVIRSFPQLPEQVGKPLNFAPMWNGAAGATYRFPAPFDPEGTASVGGNVSYRSKYRTDNDLNDDVRSFIIANLRIGYADSSRRYEAEFFIDNVFDTFTYSRYAPQQAFIAPVNERSVLGEPRTIGVDLRYHFF